MGLEVKRMSIFLSYAETDSKQARGLLDIIHETNCPVADRIESARCFVAIVTDHYSYSTLLQGQALDAAALYRERSAPRLFLYNPNGQELPLGFQGFKEAAEELPIDPGMAVEKIKARLAE